MSQKKQAVRNTFRISVFQRDRYECVICGKKTLSIETSEETLDSHHITPREEMTNGGYVKENGITLCKGNDGTSCHEKAEAYLKGESHDVAYAPGTLYRLIQSTREIADRASKSLCE